MAAVQQIYDTTADPFTASKECDVRIGTNRFVVIPPLPNHGAIEEISGRDRIDGLRLPPCVQSRANLYVR